MPRNITVTFEDGSTHVYKNAPDAVTPEQVQARASKEFGKTVKSLDGGRGSEPGIAASIGQQVGNLAAGAVRGAGSIGATLLAPVDIASDLMAGKGLTLESNRERRKAMDSALGMLGADTDSLAFGAGKLAGEIAGTAGAGGAAANLLSKVPGVAAAAPNLVAAIGSSGTQGGNLLTRGAGGAISGYIQAGLVNPEDAGTGAIVGGVAPAVIKAAGMAGQAVGRVIRGPEQSQQVAQAVKAAQDLGLVIPPTQAKASLGNRLMEGAAGKLTTAQNASVRNAAKVKEVAAKELGLTADTQLTPEVIGNVKKAAGVLYDAVGNAGTVVPGKAYTSALDDIVAPHLKALEGFPNAKPSPVISMIDSLRSESFDAASAVSKIKELRSAADDAFKPGGQGADIGRAAKKAAKALEDALDQHLTAMGEPDLLNQFRQARQLYAKASTVDNALNKASGNVDANKLASMLQKNKPLSGDLKKVAEAAAQFKTAFKNPEQMGSLPQFSPLDLYGGAGIAGVGGALTGNPLAALGLTLPLVRAGARNVALSPAVQNRLIQSARSGPTVENALALGAKAYPVLATDR